MKNLTTKQLLEIPDFARSEDWNKQYREAIKRQRKTKRKENNPPF